jgi:hypothetical protein
MRLADAEDLANFVDELKGETDRGLPLVGAAPHHTGRRLHDTASGGNGHTLRTIKRLALRADVNCGQCANKAGKSCSTYPVCRHILLHKMRKTFASTLHHKGLP